MWFLKIESSIKNVIELYTVTYKLPEIKTLRSSNLKGYLICPSGGTLKRFM